MGNRVKVSNQKFEILVNEKLIFEDCVKVNIPSEYKGFNSLKRLFPDLRGIKKTMN